MEQRLSLVTLGVADLARARRFYEEGLGWRPAQAQDDIVFYQLPGIVFALFPRAALMEDAQLTGAWGTGGLALAHNVRDRAAVDVVLAVAAEAGATIHKPAHDTFWGGYSGYFTDPDGHLWEVAWNPSWPIAADGSVSLG